jgi:Family of unknown function (DUF6325)
MLADRRGDAIGVAAATNGGIGMEAQDAELGPIDIVVIGFPAGAPMTGEAVPLLLDLVDRGIVRVLDVLFVMENEDGTFSGFEAKDVEADRIGDFKAFEGASSGLLGEQDVATAAEAIEPGTAAVMIVYENRWAAPFAAAVRRNGGELLDYQRIPVQDVIEALDAAEAVS